VLIVTQNIDNLHERGGAQGIIHMHGELLKSICNGCGAIAACTKDLSISSVCRSCDGKGTLRPQVVWFGEMSLEMERIEHALMNTGLFLSIGMSGNVYPAADFVKGLLSSC
jgi:NAD-dependent deacetylase